MGRDGGCLRVLLWSPKGAGLHYNGPGTSAYRLYKDSEQHQIVPSLAHGYLGQKPSDVFPDTCLISPLFAHDLSNIKPRVVSHGAFMWRSARWLSTHAHQYDVFHGLGAYEYSVRPAVIAERAGLPAVVKVAQHNADLASKKGLSSLFGLVAKRRRLLAEISGVIAISNEIRNELLGYGVPEGRIAHIPNGVRVEHFYPARSSKERAELRAQFGWLDLPTVLYVGGIVKRKQPHLLIQAVDRLLRRGIQCQLVLAGPEGNAKYPISLRKLVADLGINEYVRWTGFVEDPAPLYRAADLFALPSRNEGMANAALEALASGLPIVMTNVSGSTDIVIDGHNGVIVDGSVISLEQAMAIYLKDSTLRTLHGAESRERAKRFFGSSAVISAHRMLFEGIMRGEEPADAIQGYSSASSIKENSRRSATTR